MVESFLGQNAASMIVDKHLVNDVDYLRRNKVTVLGSRKFLPLLTRVSSQNVIKMWIQLQIILVQILEQPIRAQHSGNLHQLVVVVVAMKERLFTEHDCSKHAAQTPHIQRVVVQLEVHQQLRPLVIATCYSNIVLPTWVIELRKPPINESQLPLFMINHHVVRFHISMHDSLRVAEIQSFQHFVDVVANVVVDQCRIQSFEISVVDALENETWSLRLRVTHNVEQLYDVGAPA
mmetsp:Transcript_23785/g.52353  ORF Transcript_23785/g.52353 Transcript_23785/m.52353 type:complete len:234 (-) Transcript_23785:262-963(-)